MRKIIASLDIGSSLIKLVVGEIIKDKLNILACVDTPSRGIKKGYVINGESATLAFTEVFKKAEEILGVPVKKVITTIPSTYTDCFLTSSTIAITSEDKVIKNTDIIKAMQKSIANKIPENRELVTILPTIFKVNDDLVTNPLNMVAEKLMLKAVVVTVPKKNIMGINACLKKIGVDLIDIVISPLGDYSEFKTKELNKEIGAVVNIGDETTTVSIFNKGIITNLEVIDIGGDAITNDLSYVYKISREDSVYLKEHLALAHTRLAQPNESLSFTDKHNETIKINQYDASEVVMGRLVEIINLAKKQINLLTKKEISYIILTGGVVETQDFDILTEELLGNIGIIGFPKEIGARDNKYATAVGLIKYYNGRLKLRNAEFSILTEEEQEELSGIGKKINLSDNSILGKLFGYFFDN
jgi:cell division protein FtsA